jgi:hypothetical protein
MNKMIHTPSSAKLAGANREHHRKIWKYIQKYKSVVLLFVTVSPTHRNHKNIGLRNPSNSLKPNYSSAFCVWGEVVVKLGARDPNFTIEAVCGGLGYNPLLPNLGTGQLNHKVPKSTAGNSNSVPSGSA